MPVYEYTRKQKNPKAKSNKKYIWYMYEGKYTDLDGKRKTYRKRGFNLKKEAEAAERTFLVSLGNVQESLILDDVFEEMIIHSEASLKHSTIYNDQKKYKSHIQPYFGNKDMSKITVKEVQIWKTNLVKKEYAANYINNIFNAFSKTYSYAFRVYGLEYNPLRRVQRVKHANNTKVEMQTYDYETFKQFMSVIDDIVYKTLFRVLYMTGLRKGELLALTWNDFRDNRLNIDKTCSPAKGGYRITPPKTLNSIRVVQLDSKTIEQLNELKEHEKEYEDFTEKNFIFGGPKPVTTTTLERTKTKYQRMAKVPIIRTHDFRHSHVTLLANRGELDIAIAKRVGDSVTTIQKTYVHLFDKTAQSIIDTLDNLD